MFNLPDFTKMPGVNFEAMQPLFKIMPAGEAALLGAAATIAAEVYRAFPDPEIKDAAGLANRLIHLTVYLQPLLRRAWDSAETPEPEEE